MSLRGLIPDNKDKADAEIALSKLRSHPEKNTLPSIPRYKPLGAVPIDPAASCGYVTWLYVSLCMAGLIFCMAIRYGLSWHYGVLVW